MDATKVVIAVGVVVAILVVSYLAARALGAGIRAGSGPRREHEEQGFDDKP